MSIWRRLFSLDVDEDNKEKVLKNIRGNIAFAGPNLWVLACAIVVASVGLNVNSTAVVIGAMLISPLMGPIVGAGFALGMFDFDMLKKSLFNLFLSTMVGLIVSTAYFYLSPFKDPQSEILARTAPTFYDVLIAFFGGLVGVIAVTRVEKGNPIPGVAIATALMPPLCTAGFALATGNWPFFGGAMFLYVINCTFICIATYIIVKALDYPEVPVDKKNEKSVHWGISLMVLALIIPSIYLAYMFYKEQQFKKDVNNFIHTEFEEKGNIVVFKKSSYQATPKTIELAFLMKKFTQEDIDSLNMKLVGYKLPDTRLIIRQDSAFVNKQASEINLENEQTSSQQQAVQRLRSELNAISVNTDNIYKEAKAIVPNLESISVSKQRVFDSTDSVKYKTVVVYKTLKALRRQDEANLENWLEAKLNTPQVEVYTSEP